MSERRSTKLLMNLVRPIGNKAFKGSLRMRKLIVVKLLILLGTFSCGEEKQPEISENSDDLKIQYWLRKESLLPLGRVIADTIVFHDKVQISEIVYFDKTEFHEILNGHRFPSDTGSYFLNNTEFQILEKYGEGTRLTVYNIYFPSSVGSGMIYTIADGALMWYNSHNYEYLLMELDIVNGKFKNKLFYDKFDFLNIFKLLPKLCN